MRDRPDFARIRALAQQILNGLGDEAPNWTVIGVHHETGGYQSIPPEPPDVFFHSTLGRPVLGPPDSDAFVQVIVGTEDGTERVTGNFHHRLPEPEAIARLASDLQDAAVESCSAFGAALPPCPGHQHPLNPVVLDGVAAWECPKATEHYRRPIVS